MMHQPLDDQDDVPDIGEFRRWLEEDWHTAAVYYHRRKFQGGACTDTPWVKAMWPLVCRYMPDVLTTGIHALGETTDMGARIVVVDGRLTHTLPRRCPHCKKQSLVSRGSALTWCIDCKSDTESAAMRCR